MTTNPADIVAYLLVSLVIIGLAWLALRRAVDDEPAGDRTDWSNDHPGGGE